MVEGVKPGSQYMYDAGVVSVTGKSDFSIPDVKFFGGLIGLHRH